VRSLRPFVILLLLPLMSGCFGYRLMRADEIPIPSYEPREVVVPEECELLIRQAAQRVGQLTESEARGVSFCQKQQMVRAQEEEAVARKLEAHAATGRFVLQLTTVVIGALFAFLAWVF
jgi:hypothetical protein